MFQLCLNCRQEVVFAEDRTILVNECTPNFSSNIFPAVAN